MNIFYIGPFRFPIFDAAAARVLNISKTLRDLGHNVTVLSWGGHYLESDRLEDGLYYHDGIRYIITNELDGKGTVFEQFLQKRKRGKETMRILEAQSVIPDAIIMYNARYGLTKMLLSYCTIKKIKLIHDITEWFDKSDMHIDDYIPNYVNMHFLQKKIKNKICISSYLDKYYCNSHNIIIPATCDSREAKWMCNDENVVSRFKGFTGVTLIYAGAPKRKDLVHNAINAVNRLNHEGKDIRFIIVGITKEDYINKYSDLLENVSLTENIVFEGRVSQELIPTYYHLSDFMILLREPTRKCTAGFPTKFAESFISGTPVIANLTSDLGKYLIDGENGFVVQGYDTESVYKTLNEKVYFLDLQQTIRMKENTIKSSNHFDYRNWLDQLAHFMDNLQ